MSRSKPHSDAGILSDADILSGLDALAARAARGELSDTLLQAIVGATVTIFARSCEQAGYERVPVGAEITITDAVRLSVALARSQDLTPFDLSLWFGCRGGNAPASHHS